MEVLLEKSSPTLASLKVKLGKDDYQPKVDKAIKDYSKRVNLKGFRPGKVPTQVINRMYGKSILVEEVNHLLSHAVTDYIRDNKLQIVGDPIPSTEQADKIDWDTQSEFEFHYNLGLASDFELDFTKLPAIPHYTITAGEKELNDSIDNLRQRFAESSNPEESAEGDIVYGELTQASTEFSTKTAIPTKQVKAEALAQFVGLKKGDTVVFDIRQTFNDDAAIAHVTGKKKSETDDISGEFTLTVEDVSRSLPAEVNQEFFDKVLGPGNAEDEEGFKSKLMDIIQGNYQREAEAKLRFDLEKSLLDSVDIAVPADFLKDWLERINEGKFTREQIEEEFPQFEKSLKLSLIRNRAADVFGVKVEQEEILNFTRGMVMEQFGIYGNEEGMGDTIDKIVQGYLADKERDNYANIYNQVFDGKVLEVIKQNVTTESQSVDVSEFEKIAKGE